jgi:hypothetical protein
MVDAQTISIMFAGVSIGVAAISIVYLTKTSHKSSVTFNGYGSGTTSKTS